MDKGTLPGKTTCQFLKNTYICTIIDCAISQCVEFNLPL
nr:MAG TPA: hypothetical protein [Caudoviricetes sp.]